MAHEGDIMLNALIRARQQDPYADLAAHIVPALALYCECGFAESSGYSARWQAAKELGESGWRTVDSPDGYIAVCPRCAREAGVL